MKRTRSVIRVAVVGILLNLVLAGFKAFVGLVSGSISILSDAANNLTDTISAIITIFGVILGHKKPDKKHPHGHKHLEHLSALVIAVIILITAISLIVSSVQRIITPEAANFDIQMLIIIFAGIIVKVFLSFYFTRRGKKLKSHALIASGKDAMHDVMISSGTLIGALITYLFGITIDGWIGALVSIFMLKSGLEIAVTSFKKYSKAKGR